MDLKFYAIILLDVLYFIREIKKKKSATHSHLFSVPIISWIGIFPIDLMEENEEIKKHEIMLTEKDKSKLENLLNKPYFDFKGILINKNNNRMGESREI